MPRISKIKQSARTKNLKNRRYREAIKQILAKHHEELYPLINRSTMKTDYKELNDVSTPIAVSEQDIATSILSSAIKKNFKQIVNGYLLFVSEVGRSIMAANPDGSFAYINRLIATRWRRLSLSRKTVYRERAHRLKEEARLISKGIPQSPAGSRQETSDWFDSSFLEPEIVIKEEPIHISEDPTPSRLDHEFILPCSNSYQSCSTPAIKEVFTVVKTEPMEEITSNCKTTKQNKQQTSEAADVAKQMNTNGGTTKPNSRKTSEKDNVLELTENTPTDGDAATSKTNSFKDSVDVYGEYIAAKKNSKQIVNGYILFACEVRRSIITANPDRSFGYISRLIGARWHYLPIRRKIDYRKRAHRQNMEAQLQLMSKGMPQSSASSKTSDCFDSSFLEPEMVIKEEPIDISEDPTPSRLDHEFILPCSDSYQSCSTPAIKEVFTVVKTEPI